MARVKNRHSNYLERFSKEIKIAADKAGIEYEEGVELLDEYFLRVRQLIDDPRKPKVNLPGFAWFGPSLGKVKKYISRRIQSHKKHKYPKGAVDLTIKELYPIYKRLSNQKNGKEKLTDEWNAIDPLEYRIQSYQGLKTNLPEGYHSFDCKQWLEFYNSKPRNRTHYSKSKTIVEIYNSLIGRLCANGGDLGDYQKRIELDVLGSGKPTVKDSNNIKTAKKLIEEYGKQVK